MPARQSTTPLLGLVIAIGTPTAAMATAPHFSRELAAALAPLAVPDTAVAAGTVKRGNSLLTFVSSDGDHGLIHSPSLSGPALRNAVKIRSDAQDGSSGDGGSVSTSDSGGSGGDDPPQSVPEPASLILLVAGIGGLLRSLRRRA